MDKKLRPMERIEQLDNLWSWFERLGLVKTMIGGALGGGIFTYAVSQFQHFPRWLILGLVFVVSSLLLVIMFAGIVWLISFIQRQIKKLVSENPLTERVLALEQSLGHRHLTDEQKSQLLKEISQETGQIKVIAANPDDDAGRYAEEFTALLREAGWAVWGVDRPYNLRTGTKIGITLLATHPAPGILDAAPSTQRFADALAAIGVKFHYFISYELPQGSCELIIGHRGETAY